MDRKFWPSLQFARHFWLAGLLVITSSVLNNRSLRAEDPFADLD